MIMTRQILTVRNKMDTTTVDPYQGLRREKTMAMQILRIAIAYGIVIITLFLLN
ncbi:MAG: hypothetical protein GXP14_04425 [Gammaproteobacteria bacterium]|nr:hypothetical protein [Gammaproteobacteria bacterium]